MVMNPVGSNPETITLKKGYLFGGEPFFFDISSGSGGLETWNIYIVKRGAWNELFKRVGFSGCQWC